MITALMPIHLQQGFLASLPSLFVAANRVLRRTWPAGPETQIQTMILLYGHFLTFHGAQHFSERSKNAELVDPYEEGS